MPVQGLRMTQDMDMGYPSLWRGFFKGLTQTCWIDMDEYMLFFDTLIDMLDRYGSDSIVVCIILNINGQQQTMDL